MKITDITAIIAIVLSLINLGIVLKKEIFKPKPSLKFYIKNAQIRYWGKRSQRSTNSHKYIYDTAYKI